MAQWELYKKLTEYRDELRDDLAVILAGQAEPLRKLLYAAPPLAARFRAVVNFPGYTPAQLGAIFAILADEAGCSLTPEAERTAAALLAQAEADRACGNARLAVRLLTQVTAAQARRVAASSEAQLQVGLSAVIEADIPQHLDRDDPPSDEALVGPVSVALTIKRQEQSPRSRWRPGPRPRPRPPRSSRAYPVRPAIGSSP